MKILFYLKYIFITNMFYLTCNLMDNQIHLTEQSSENRKWFLAYLAWPVDLAAKLIIWGYLWPQFPQHKCWWKQFAPTPHPACLEIKGADSITPDVICKALYRNMPGKSLLLQAGTGNYKEQETAVIGNYNYCCKQCLYWQCNMKRIPLAL